MKNYVLGTSSKRKRTMGHFKSVVCWQLALNLRILSDLNQKSHLNQNILHIFMWGSIFSLQHKNTVLYVSSVTNCDHLA